MKIVVTGAGGFIGKNLMVQLASLQEHEVIGITRQSSMEDLFDALQEADVVYHLAGVNRPDDESEFQKVNTRLTQTLVRWLEQQSRPYRLIFTSSYQAGLDNPYGQSKLGAEHQIEQQVKNGRAVIYRLPGVFGKWCRPFYNSVVATFCHQVAHQEDLVIRDESHAVNLVYIDDVCQAFIRHLEGLPPSPGVSYDKIQPAYTITLGDLAQQIQSFRLSRLTLILPEIGDALCKKLYSTYMTYLPEDAFSYPLELKTDQRGNLFELLKTQAAGQIFVSTTKPGITRGNHYHHTKTEKFIVVSGEGLIRFRKIGTENVIEYRVNGEQPMVVDIPPGYTHSLTNIGPDDMVALFWANEIFNPERPDTVFQEV